ncbi:MAG: penicillin-binding protein 2 [Candidatus Coatesbacteria bacterium]|nr:penicillin-binding protein 2 [Candidatus Coatesbacteria bacterium]
MPIDFGEDAQLLERLRRKMRLVFALFLVSATVILGRLWFLQVLNAATYTKLCEQNRIRIVEDKAPRGLILDRYGERIVSNRPSYDIQVDMGNKQAAESLRAFVELAEIPAFKMTRTPYKIAGSRTVSAIEDVSFSTLSILEEHRLSLPGLEVAVRPMRRYGDPTLACHVVGYLGEATKTEIARSEGALKLGDKTGRSGIEAAFDESLRGKSGSRLVETNALGRVLQTLRTAGEPQQGNSVVLTIDLELQREVEELLQARKGAVVVLNPHSGEVLAMVSKPVFSLDAFEGMMSSDQWRSLRDDPDTPLNNRCLTGQYPPGSTFKIVVALAGLESQSISVDTEYTCLGYMRLGDSEFRCWKEGGHGEMSLHDAIAQSCNVFFYRTGLQTGIAPIAEMARRFGLGEATGFAISREATGHIPSEKEFSRYYAGDVVSASIGQGTILVTPLQMAVAFSALVNGGKVMRPYIVSRIMSPTGKALKRFGPLVRRQVSVSPELLQVVRSGLFSVVNDNGTGWRAKVRYPAVAGKTGTAQVVQRVDNEEMTLEEIPYDRRPHSWFVGYAPAEHPEICFAVIVEHGGGGGGEAATCAGKIVRAAFSDLENGSELQQ